MAWHLVPVNSLLLLLGLEIIAIYRIKRPSLHRFPGQDRKWCWSLRLQFHSSSVHLFKAYFLWLGLVSKVPSSMSALVSLGAVEVREESTFQMQDSWQSSFRTTAHWMISTASELRLSCSLISVLLFTQHDNIFSMWQCVSLSGIACVDPLHHSSPQTRFALHAFHSKS